MSKLTPARKTFLAAAVLIALATGTVWQAVRWVTGATEYPNYPIIVAGDSRQRVIALMGTSFQETDTFRLGQRLGHEDEYARAATSGAAVWLVYHGGLDQTFTIGLDPADRVVYKARGGT